MDYVDFVVHVFLEDKRDFYRLERLWGDARKIDPATLPTEETFEDPTARGGQAARP